MHFFIVIVLLDKPSDQGAKQEREDGVGQDYDAELDIPMLRVPLPLPSQSD